MQTRREFMRKSAVALGGIAFGGTSLGGFARAASAASTAGKAGSLAVVTGYGSGSIFNYSLVLMQSYAKKLGVDVSLTSLKTALIRPALVSGEADLIMGFSPLTALGLADAGADAIVVADMVPISDYVIAVNSDTIKKPTDLYGKKLATSGPGTQSDMVSRLLVAQKGLDWGSIDIVPIASSTSRLPALLAGSIDAASLYHDQAFTAQAQNPKIRILLDSARIVPTIFASAEGLRSKLEAKRDEVEKVLMAYAQVAAFAKLHPTKFVDGFMKAYPEAVRSAALKTTKFYGQKGYWDPDLKTHADILVTNGAQAVTAANPPLVPKTLPLSQWVDITYRNHAIKKLGGVGWWKPKPKPKPKHKKKNKH
ncbi:MAG TPA: ABC transporter substrate-binding protein [Gaiellaceae bacterium]|nr:ABC transporter substrate-binding protein [Gaiellaceae bacterium]